MGNNNQHGRPSFGAPPAAGGGGGLLAALLGLGTAAIGVGLASGSRKPRTGLGRPGQRPVAAPKKDCGCGR